jgi:hypothetical protein
MNDEERAALEEWAGRLRSALGLNDLELDIDGVLDLAGVAARSVVRPAAPLTTFLVGYAAGRAAAGGTDPARAVREATSVAETQSAAD